ncbi:hypothetical protein SSS_05118 [Sarcoptes scabiei]|uniref:Uncharacterized protein n=1 Tax=Sarcoptes scabiei TaxID=52283 RepID=A0A834R2R2_SARSC|nr:hypothetical protein SSS_05118 [Sarcoptes scabiei]UXI17375.1 Phospholipase D1 [Sarcoptes scabiei]
MANLLISSSRHLIRMQTNQKILSLQFKRALSALTYVRPNPKGYKSWKEIPDSELPKSPDPTNPLYDTPGYKRIQKKRIWYEMNPDVPVYLREGLIDQIRFRLYYTLLILLTVTQLYIVITEIIK